MSIMEFQVTKLCFLVYFFVCAAANPARRSYEQINEMYSRIIAIEDIVKSEDRMISVLNMGIVASSVDRLNKRVDHIVNILEQGQQAPIGGIGRSTVIAPRDVVSNLQEIDTRLRSLEETVENVEQSVEKTGETFQKMEEVDRRTNQMKDDLNQKLRKMMNVMTALYEMNKEMKTGMVTRSGNDDNDARSTSSSTPNYATDFLLENLEEMERKIREQFSVLGNELRTEMTSLRIVASSAGSRCDSVYSEDEDLQESGTQVSASPRSGRRASGNSVSDSRVEDTLDVLVQSLGNSTREIREEIHQGIQDIDSKLTNIGRMSCSEGLVTSESIVTSRKVPPPQQDVAPKAEVCSKVARNVTSPQSCADLRRGGATCDGVYVIFPQNVRAVRALCDMTTEGGGWTVLMQRGDFNDKMSGFHKNWASYKNGFGDVEGEFWLGNDVIHLLSAQDENILRVNLEAFDGDVLNLTYSSFTVADENDNYKLRLGVTVGTPSPASNSLRYHSNHPFSTFDKKNDNFEQNCAATYKGGWWFNGCYFGFLTGEYFRPGEKRENWQGILWYDWKGNASLKGAQMKIRPKDFSP